MGVDSLLLANGARVVEYSLSDFVFVKKFLDHWRVYTEVQSDVDGVLCQVQYVWELVSATGHVSGGHETRYLAYVGEFRALDYGSDMNDDNFRMFDGSWGWGEPCFYEFLKGKMLEKLVGV